MGLVMGRHPELAVPPEPASADTYFETAIDMLVEQYPTNNEDPSKAKKLSENVRLQFTWADAYFLRADVAASELIEADDMSEASKNISELMQQGYEHALHAQASAPAYFALPPAAQDEAESTPAQSSSTASPSGEEDKQIPERLPQLTVNRLNGYFGARVWDILEQLDDEAAGLEGDDMQETWRERSGAWLKNAGLQASLPGEEDAQYASVVGKAKEKLAEVATLLASEEEDGDESEAVDAGKEEENTGKARPMLDEVLKDLDAALEIAKGCTGRSDLIISVDELETTELAQEALLYRINISLDDADREQWIQYAKNRQIDIDDEDEEDDEGEEEEEMEE
ncbi:hypothetical protein DL93DRAFT_2087108 [Clavulina sp. PMI_390]|nr:hypothetical protein DL93DRAFT_2087108 [Clavulina sp. PMI_390]